MNSKNSHDEIDKITILEIWIIMVTADDKKGKAAFDCYFFLTTKQARGESVEHLYWKFKEQLQNNFQIVNQEETYFGKHMANLLELATQKDSIQETLEPHHPLTVEAFHKPNINAITFQERNLIYWNLF